MKIESIELRNYRLFRHAKLTDLPSMAILVGANGSGKSTLFDVLGFLQDALTHSVTQAVARRGGFRELVSRGEEGPIEIEITIAFGESGEDSVAYELKIGVEERRPVVEHELLVAVNSAGSQQSYRVVDVSRGEGVAFAGDWKSGSDSPDLEKQVDLEDPGTLAIKGLGQFSEFQAIAKFSSLLEGWHISDLHIHDARPSAEVGYAEHLTASGDNIAQVAQHLYEHHPKRFRRVLEVMRARVPGITSVEARPTEDGRLVLRFQDGSFKDPFIARYVSDGTIKMFAYLILLHDPKPHPLLAVEEPENQLYPALLRELAEEFRDYARRGGQVLVSTHSPEFLNGAKLDEIYWLVKKDGFATVRRASESELLRDLYAEGDLPGALWKQRLFEGADPA